MIATTSAPPRRALVLVNPNARRGTSALDPVLARLEAGGIRCRVERFETPQAVSTEIVASRDGIDLVVVCGGDGTINSAARGVLETGLPMGIIPLGTANDLARTLGLPLDPAAAADVIAQGHRRRLDLGEVNGHCFFNVASMGLSADLARGLTRETKQRWGQLGYAIAAFKVLLAAKPFRATITNKDVTVEVKTLQIAVGNGVHYGGGNVVAKGATIEDGHLDLYSLELRNVWTLALRLGAFRRGEHGAWDEVRTVRCTEFDIRTPTPQPINTDGDIVTHTPAHFLIRPDAVSVFAPRPATA